MITKTLIKEFADRIDFEVIESGKHIGLRAKFEFSDGYGPSAIPLTAKEAFVCLQGFSDGKYE